MGEEILPVMSAKYLGVILNETLNWDQQVDQMLLKAIRSTFGLKRFSSVIKEPNIAVQLYESLVRPCLEYAATVWHFGLTSAQRKKLQRQEQIVSRIIGKKLEREKTLHERRLKKCIQKYRQLESKPDSVLHKFICKKLHHTGKYRLHKMKTERLKKSFFYSTPIVINSIQWF